MLLTNDYVVCSQNGEVLDMTHERYDMLAEYDGVVRYQSFLLIQSSTKDDHGDYECRASNELGQAAVTVRLDGTSKS